MDFSPTMDVYSYEKGNKSTLKNHSAPLIQRIWSFEQMFCSLLEIRIHFQEITFDVVCWVPCTWISQNSRHRARISQERAAEREIRENIVNGSL